MGKSPSKPTAYTSDPARVGVRATPGAPTGPLAPATAPVPPAPVNVTTVSDCMKPKVFGVDVTTTFDSVLAASAVQISAAPDCTLTRAIRLHDNPAPVTVVVW